MVLSSAKKKIQALIRSGEEMKTAGLAEPRFLEIRSLKNKPEHRSLSLRFIKSTQNLFIS